MRCVGRRCSPRLTAGGPPPLRLAHLEVAEPVGLTGDREDRPKAAEDRGGGASEPPAHLVSDRRRWAPAHEAGTTPRALRDRIGANHALSAPLYAPRRHRPGRRDPRPGRQNAPQPFGRTGAEKSCRPTGPRPPQERDGSCGHHRPPAEPHTAPPPDERALRRQRPWTPDAEYASGVTATRHAGGTAYGAGAPHGLPASPCRAPCATQTLLSALEARDGAAVVRSPTSAARREVLRSRPTPGARPARTTQRCSAG